MTSARSLVARLVAFVLSVLLPAVLCAESVTLPVGTYVYGELDETLTSKKKETAVGDIVRARVWRDVVVEGRVLIEAGAPMITRVSMVKPARIAGRKGDVHLEAVTTTAVDGSEVLLDGGYDKSGKGRKALSWTLAALVAWPLVFIKGKQAVLEPGTVFDAAVQANQEVTADAARAFAIEIDDTGPSFEIEVLYDEMDPDAKHQILPLRLRHCRAAAASAAVVAVNEREIAPIPVKLGEGSEDGLCTLTRGTVDLDALAKHFTRGINRFEVQTAELRTEVLLEIEL